MERQVFFKIGALERFRKCRSSQEAKTILKANIENLKANPNLGYPVPFQTNSPHFYQLRVRTAPETTYWIHYIFDDNEISLLYVGVPGRC